MNRIKDARRAKGLTQIELSQMLGVTQGNLSAWETGRWEPEVDTLKRLCEALDCSADFLLGRNEKMQHKISDAEVTNIYMHLAKEMEEMQLPEADVLKILDFARYMKEKNDKIKQ